MNDSGAVWALRRRDDGRKLADLVVTGGDFPWLNARVDPVEGFEDLRPLFAEELLRLDHIDDDTKAWEQAYDAVRAVVTLWYPDGQEVPDFLLHLDGGVTLLDESASMIGACRRPAEISSGRRRLGGQLDRYQV